MLTVGCLMLFRRIIFNALVIGLLTGFLLTVVQYVGVSPIIFAAEEFEVADEEPVLASSAHGEHDHGGHHHDAEAWAPEDGVERTFYTFLSNIFAGIGFSVVLLALMSQLQIKGVTTLTVAKGLAWGTAGFIAFFAAPGIGLPPEIPGVQAAALEHRQWWWLFTVAASGAGLYVLAFAPNRMKLLGAGLIAMPYIVGAPHIAGPEFVHPDANAVATLTGLHHQFIIASSLANLVFWLALGALSAWVLNRRVLKDIASNAAARA